jgi:hypothetical protein
MEKMGNARLVEDILKCIEDKKIDPLLLSIHYPDLLDIPSKQWLSIDPGYKDVNSAIVDFYKSDYSTKLPINNIAHVLYAEKLSGNEELKDSDKTDVDNIAAFLPYVNYMLLDKAMIDKVKKHGLDKKYQAKLFRLPDIDNIIAEIKSKIQ